MGKTFNELMAEANARSRRPDAAPAAPETDAVGVRHDPPTVPIAAPEPTHVPASAPAPAPAPAPAVAPVSAVGSESTQAVPDAPAPILGATAPVLQEPTRATQEVPASDATQWTPEASPAAPPAPGPQAPRSARAPLPPLAGPPPQVPSGPRAPSQKKVLGVVGIVVGVMFLGPMVMGILAAVGGAFTGTDDFDYTDDYITVEGEDWADSDNFAPAIDSVSTMPGEFDFDVPAGWEVDGADPSEVNLWTPDGDYIEVRLLDLGAVTLDGPDGLFDVGFELYATATGLGDYEVSGISLETAYATDAVEVAGDSGAAAVFLGDDGTLWGATYLDYGDGLDPGWVETLLPSLRPAS